MFWTGISFAFPVLKEDALPLPITAGVSNVHIMSSDLRANQPPVPNVPPEITGPCAYGHILTKEHEIHFGLLHPHIPKTAIDDFDSLVSIASLFASPCNTAHTAHVYDEQGKEQVCLMLVGHRNRSRLNDWRCGDFMVNMVKSLGITGEPKWYAYRRR